MSRFLSDDEPKKPIREDNLRWPAAALHALVELLPRMMFICQTKAVGYAHNTKHLNV